MDEIFVDAVTNFHSRLHALPSNPPPALVISGPPGCGKGMVARHWARALLCETSDLTEPVACGTCASCARAQKNQWIDLWDFAPEIGDSGRLGKISVDAFRELKSKQGMGPHLGRYKIVLIHDAQLMTSQAANSILKILEEPPRQWLIWMTTPHPSLLLPTIVSRCQRIQLQPLGHEVIQDLIERWGEGISAERRALILSLSHGNLDQVRRMCQDEYWSGREKIFRALAYPQRELTAVLDWCSESQVHLDQTIDTLESVALDLSSQAHASNEWQNRDAQPWLDLQWSKHSSAIYWADRAHTVAQARAHLLLPVNRKLTIQTLLMLWVGTRSSDSKRAISS